MHVLSVSTVINLVPCLELCSVWSLNLRELWLKSSWMWCLRRCGNPVTERMPSSDLLSSNSLSRRLSPKLPRRRTHDILTRSSQHRPSLLRHPDKVAPNHTHTHTHTVCLIRLCLCGVTQLQIIRLLTVELYRVWMWQWGRRELCGLYERRRIAAQLAR